LQRTILAHGLFAAVHFVVIALHFLQHGCADLLLLDVAMLGQLFQSHIFLDCSRNRFFVYFIFATVRLLKPNGQSHGPFAGIAASTANGQVISFAERPLIVEVLYSCSGRAHRMRGLLHQDTAVYASFVSCSNLLLIFLRNTVCVGHGSR
jgi:hypothetical protein